ncbi:MAG: nitroreductase family protein [Blautia sp.]|nr:nitroreductase family protein [Blautia sp.]
MEFIEVIQNRFSCKRYDGRPVEREKLEAILKAAQAAPTAKNLQEHHIYIVESAEALVKLDECTPCRYGAETVAIVTYDKNRVFTYPGEKLDSGMEDGAIVATHMLLAAANEGVDSCWINRFDPEQVSHAFGLPENEVAFMLLDLGYRAEGTGPLENHFKRRELSETVTYL